MSTTLLTELDKKIPIAGLDPPQCHAEEIFPSRIRVHTAGNPAPSQTRPVSGSSWSDAALNSRGRGKFGGGNDQVSGPKRQSSFPTIQDKRQSNCPALVHAGSLPVPLPLGQLGNIRKQGKSHATEVARACDAIKSQRPGGVFLTPPPTFAHTVVRGDSLLPSLPLPPLPHSPVCPAVGHTRGMGSRPEAGRAAAAYGNGKEG